MFSGNKYISLQPLSFFAFAIAPIMLLTFSTSLSILLPAMSCYWLHTHTLKFLLLETSMYTTLTGSNPLTLVWEELRLFISLFPTSWNKLSNILPTRVPDRHDHAANTLDLFFTSNPQNYTYTVSSPLGSSDHCTVSITSSFTPPPPIPPTQRHLWHFQNPGVLIRAALS